MTIEYVKTEYGISILPSEKEARSILKKITSTPKGDDDEKGEKKAERDRIAQEYFDKIMAVREEAVASKKLVVLNVSYEPYTREQKMEARRLATTGNGEESRFDSEVFEAHLIAMSTDLDYQTVVAQPESVYQLLAEKVFSGQNVPVDRLDFFGSSPTT